MDWVLSIQKAIDYIEENLTEDISYEKIASLGFSSSFHFQRIFSLLCGYSLGEYIRLRRLTLAGIELSRGESKVIDVALKYGYDSPDSFAKAFFKFHGITPSQARAEGSTLKSFSPLSIKISLEGGNTMDYRIEEKEAFNVIEKVEIHTTENDENLKSITKFWERAHADGTVDKLEDLASDKKYLFGVCYENKNPKEKTFEYSIATICDNEIETPEGFRKNTIPKNTWLIFTCIGAMPHAIQEGWKKIFSEFFPTSVYRPTGKFDIEAYPDGDTNSADYLSEIWIPVERK